jgi:hypothetical protein
MTFEFVEPKIEFLIDEIEDMIWRVRTATSGTGDRKPDAALQQVLELAIDNNCYIAGGYARWLASPNRDPAPYGDIDIFGKEKFSTETLKDLLLAEIEGARVAYTSDWAYRIQVPVEGSNPDSSLHTINLIRANNHAVYSTYGPPEKVVGRFDFTITMIWFDELSPVLKNGNRRLPVIFHHIYGWDDHESDRELHLSVFKHPVHTLERIIKYCNKGYTMDFKALARFLLLCTTHQPLLEAFTEWHAGRSCLTQPQIRDVYRSL